MATAAEGSLTSVSLDNRVYHLTLTAATGHCEILDKQTQVTWGAADPQAPFGWINVRISGKSSRFPLGRCELAWANQQDWPAATFHPLPDKPDWAVRVRFENVRRGGALQLSYDADPGVEIESLAPLANVLTATRDGKGYLLVPVREGLLIPADSGLKFEHRFDTYAYEGCHMEMLGAVQNNSAVLATWEDPYVAVDVRSSLGPVDSPANGQRVDASLVMSKSARSFRLRFLGDGDYVTIAKAYRQVARDRGLLVTWDQKLKGHPERAKLFGAANIKLWSALDRRMNEASTQEESVRTNWTFAEAAQVAEHYKRDLQLDRVLFTIGGWIHRGYDNQHPDILPTAPECGGDAAFSDCARRVLSLGYLFCLHDNYQDMYRDSPSWNERFIMKTRDGQLARGGHWAGGMAFLTCSKMALELAERPQNLRGVRQLSNANAYFIDTTYAAGLQECFDPEHPLTRADDMKWKQALSDYARGVFGVFGSEDGREWAVPHSDFFEGLTGVSGHPFHDASLADKLGATVVPLFDLVYRDCIALYGKYGYDPNQAASYVLEHISLGRPLNYHSIPPHLYWKNARPEEESLALTPGLGEFSWSGQRRFKITYRWQVEKPPTEPWQVFVHFTDAAGNIKFQNDHQPEPAVTQWQPGEVNQGPFTVTIPEGLNGTFDVRMGLYQPSTGRRARLRGRRARDRGYLIGKLTVTGDRVDFKSTDGAQPNGDPTAGLFTEADNGWAAGLDTTDRFIKNTYEILSPLNELTARLQMTWHEFLTPDRKVQRTVFGQGAERVTVTVNFGRTDYVCRSEQGERVRLPAWGFVIESPTFVSFYARNWNGREYEQALPLFTLRSLDGRPLSSSRKVRVFHAFGEELINLRANTFSVAREAILDPKTPSAQ